MTEPDPFMIRAHVPHWEASVEDYGAASAATRARLSSRLDLAFGDHPDEKLDLFFPAQGRAGEARPVHLFVHGGYWRSFSKQDYAFVADAVTDCGAVAAIVDYSLMPAARMETLVGQVRRAARWLQRHAAQYGGDPGAISASGHSAGAHLASFLVCKGKHEVEPQPSGIRSVLLVSGLYDLAPVSRSFVQPELRLTEAEIAHWSPISADRSPDSDAEIRVIVGERETAPFREQAVGFADHLARSGARSSLATVPGQDHMTIVRELGRPGTACAEHLAAVIRSSMTT